MHGAKKVRVYGFEVGGASLKRTISDAQDWVLSASWCFNPGPRDGGDFELSTLFSRRRVSIHAPAKGATSVDGALQPQ